MPSASDSFAKNKIMWTLVIVRCVSLFVPKVNEWVKAHIDDLIAFEVVRGVVFEWVRTKIYAEPRNV